MKLEDYYLDLDKKEYLKCLEGCEKCIDRTFCLSCDKANGFFDLLPLSYNKTLSKI